MLLFLYGNDDFRISERLRFLRNAFQAKYDEQGLNSADMNGAEFDIDDFRKHAKSGGLFSTKRFIALTNVWALHKDQQQALLEELDSIDTETILCVSGEQPPKKTNELFQRLLSADTVEEYQELNPQQLRTFIKERVQKLNATIELQAVEHLAASIGNDLWRMSTEIQRLAQYSKRISTQTVTTFVDETVDDNIFHLTDALGSKDAKRALSLLEQQFASGANEQYLITMISKHLATLCKVIQTEGKGLQLHPYVLEKSKRQARLFTVGALRSLCWRLLEIDQQLKTTTSNPAALLDLFIIEACNKTRPV